MSGQPRSRKAKVDSNQNEIVADLRKIPGVTVYPGYDDLIIGHHGFTHWVEVKNTTAANKLGRVRPSAFRKSQKDILREFTGSYLVATTTAEIVAKLGIQDSPVQYYGLQQLNQLDSIIRTALSGEGIGSFTGEVVVKVVKGDIAGIGVNKAGV